MSDMQIDIIVSGNYEVFHFNPLTLVITVKLHILKKHGYKTDDANNWEFKSADGHSLLLSTTLEDAEKYGPQPFFLSLRPGVGA